MLVYWDLPAMRQRALVPFLLFPGTPLTKACRDILFVLRKLSHHYHYNIHIGLTDEKNFLILLYHYK